MQTFISTPARKLVVGLTLAAGAIILVSSSACSVTVTNTCNGGLAYCDGFCVDLSSDPNYCGSCADSCLAGDICVSGTCVVGVCATSGSSCTVGGDCCTGYCVNGICACLSTGSYGCNASDDCCSGSCDLQTGYCN